MTSQATMGTLLSTRLDISIKGIRYHTSNNEFNLNNIIVKDNTFREKHYSTKALLCLTDYIGLLPPVVPCYRSYMKVCRCIFAMSFSGKSNKIR